MNNRLAEAALIALTCFILLIILEPILAWFWAALRRQKISRYDKGTAGISLVVIFFPMALILLGAGVLYLNGLAVMGGIAAAGLFMKGWRLWTMN